MSLGLLLFNFYCCTRFERYRGLALALSATNLGEAAGPALSAISKADIYIHLALRIKHSFSGRGFLCARFYLARARQICQALNGNAPARLQWLSSPGGYRFFLSHVWEYDSCPSELFTSLSNKSDPLAFTMQVCKFQLIASRQRCSPLFLKSFLRDIVSRFQWFGV